MKIHKSEILSEDPITKQHFGLAFNTELTNSSKLLLHEGHDSFCGIVLLLKQDGMRASLSMGSIEAY